MSGVYYPLNSPKTRDDPALQEIFDVNDGAKGKDNSSLMVELLADGKIEQLKDRINNQNVSDYDLLAQTWDGQNILSSAADLGYDDVVALVLNKLDYKLLPDYTYAPLYNAVCCKHKRTVNVLLDRMCDIDLTWKNGIGSTALHVAAGNKANVILDKLLSHGAPVNIVNIKGYTPLHKAVASGNTLGVKMLLKYGASVNERANDGNTPMHLAVALLETTSPDEDDMDFCDDENIMDAIFDAVDTSDLDANKMGDIVDMLALAGADLDIKNNKDQTVLDVCSTEGVRAQIEKEIHFRTEFPIHYMIRSGDEKELEEWIETDGIKWYYFDDQRPSGTYLLTSVVAAPANEENIKYFFAGVCNDEAGSFNVSGQWFDNGSISITKDFGPDDPVLNLMGAFNHESKSITGTDEIDELVCNFMFKPLLWPCNICHDMIPLRDTVCSACNSVPIDEIDFKKWVETETKKIQENIDMLVTYINHCDDEGRTPIMIAAIYARPQILKMLIEHTKNYYFSDKDENGKTSLDHASYRKLACRRYYDNDPNVDILACVQMLQNSFNDEVDFKFTLGMNADERNRGFCYGDCLDDLKISLTEMARSNDWDDIASYLKDNKEPSDSIINEIDSIDNGLIHYIIQNKKVSHLELLSKKKYFDYDLLNGANEYPLYMATQPKESQLQAFETKEFKMVDILLKAGADPSKLIAPGHNSYSKHGNKQLELLEDGPVKQLLVAKAKLKQFSPLYYTVGVNDISEAEQYQKEGKSAMHIVIQNKLSFKIFQSLIEQDQHIVNSLDTNGDTPLILAAKEGLVGYVQWLVENEADVDIKNKQGKTALMLAALNGHTDIVNLLIEHIADIDIEDKSGKTVINLLDDELARIPKKDRSSSIQRTIRDTISSEDQRRETSLVYREKLSKSLIDLNVIEAFNGNGFSKAINCSPILGRTFLNDCVSMDRHNVHFNNLDVVYGASVRGSALYSVLNMKTDDEDLIFEAKKECLEHVVMRRIMEIKWELFGQRKYIESLLMYLLLLSAMTMSSILFNDNVVESQSSSTLDFAMFYGTIFMVFTVIGLVVVQLLRPATLWCLARFSYDREWKLEPEENILDLQADKQWVKKCLFLLTIILTAGFSSLVLAIMKHWHFELYFMTFNNVVLAFSSLYFIVTEIHELVAAPSSYFKDFINCTQLSMYFLIIALFVPAKLGFYGTVDRAIQVGLGGFISITLWILTLQFLEVVPNTSYLLPLTARLMKDVWNFFLFLAVFQIGTTITYYQLFVDKDDDAFGSLFQSFYSAFFVLFGQFPTDSLSVFNTTLTTQDKAHSNEYYLYTFTVLLMMFHAAACAIILMNLLMASMNKTVDGGLERAHTEALASYAKAILRLEVSNYSEEENKNLMYLDHEKKVLNPIFTQPVHKAKLHMTSAQEEMIQKHLDAITSRQNKARALQQKTLEAVDAIKSELNHIEHFTSINVKDEFREELALVEKTHERVSGLFNELEKSRDQVTMLEKVKRLVKESMAEASGQANGIWKREMSEIHSRCVILYQMTYKRNLMDSFKRQQEIICNHFDAAICEAKVGVKEEPKVSEVIALLEGMNRKFDALKQEVKTNAEAMGKQGNEGKDKVIKQTADEINRMKKEMGDKLDSLHNGFHGEISEKLEHLDNIDNLQFEINELREKNEQLQQEMIARLDEMDKMHQESQNAMMSKMEAILTSLERSNQTTLQ